MIIPDVPSESVETDPDSETTARGGAMFWVGVGVAVLFGLLVAGFIVQGLIPKPLEAAGTSSLPASVKAPDLVMTDGDVDDKNASIFWIEPDKGDKAILHTRKPLEPGPGRKIRSLKVKDFGRKSWDIASWPPLEEPALFSFEQKPRSLEVTVTPTERAEGGPRDYRLPIPKPVDQVNDFAMATWGGAKPDLFVLSRGSDQKLVRLRVFSGESGFREILLEERLPFAGLDPRVWSFDIARLSRDLSIGAATQDSFCLKSVRRPDLLLVRHDPDREFVDVQLMPGERFYKSNSYQRDIDIPGDVSPSSRFLLGWNAGNSAVYAVQPGRRDSSDVSVFELESSTNVK